MDVPGRMDVRLCWIGEVAPPVLPDISPRSKCGIYDPFLGENARFLTHAVFLELQGRTSE